MISKNMRNMVRGLCMKALIQNCHLDKSYHTFVGLDSFWLALGWVDRLLFSQIKPDIIKANKSKDGPILGSPRWLEKRVTKPLVKCLMFPPEGINLLEFCDQLWSASSGTSSGALVFCRKNAHLSITNVLYPFFTLLSLPVICVENNQLHSLNLHQMDDTIMLIKCANIT